jgi:chromosome segregation ATPase
MKSILAILTAALVSCSHSVPPIAHVGPAPAKSAEVAPVALQVREDAAAAAVVSDKVERGVDAATKRASALSTRLDAVQAEADRLRKLTAFTEDERNSIFALYDDTKKEMRNLFVELESVSKDAANQKSMRVTAEANLMALSEAALLRDTEVIELRAQREDFTNALDQARTSLAESEKNLASSEKRAAVGSYLKGMAVFITIGILVIIAFWVLLKTSKPI